MTSYFYVSKIGGGKPSYQHPSFASAMTEAERLIDTVGGEYEILQARVVVKSASRYIVTNLRTTELPAVPYPSWGNEDDLSIPF